MSTLEQQELPHSNLRINLLGEMAVSLDGESVRLPKRLRTRQLFAFLLLNQVAIPRTDAAAQLWPDLSAAKALATLRRHLGDLQSYLNTSLHGYVTIARTQQGVQLVFAGEHCLDTAAILMLADTMQSELAAWQEVQFEELSRLFALASRPILEQWNDLWLQSSRLRILMARQTLSGALGLATSHQREHLDTVTPSVPHSGYIGEFHITQTQSRSNIDDRQRASAFGPRRSTQTLQSASPDSDATNTLSIAGPGIDGEPRVALTGEPLKDPPASSLRSLERRCPRSMVPVHLDAYVNRVHELEVLHQHLMNSSLVVVSGEMGIGKSRFVAEYIRFLDCQIDEPTFWFAADSYTSSARQDGTPFANATRCIQDIRKSYDDLCASHQRGFPLVIFDGFDNALSTLHGAIMEAKRICPHVRIIATLRSELGLSGVPYLMLTPLSTIPPTDRAANSSSSCQSRDAASDAESLFLTRVSELGKRCVTQDERRMLTATLPLRSEGNPLIIEALAARTSIMSIQEIMDMVRLALPSRCDNYHSTIRALKWRKRVEYEWNQFASESRSCMEKAWIFRKTFGREHVLSVWHEEHVKSLLREDIRRVIEPLIECGWVLNETGHDTGILFRVPMLIREFAQLEARSNQSNPTLRQEHARFVLSRIAVLMSQQPDLDEGVLESIFDAERDDLDAAITAFQIFTTDDLRIAVNAALESWRFWIDRGMLANEIRWVDHLVIKAVNLGDEGLHALASDVAAMMHYAQGDVESAARHGRNAVLSDRSAVCSRQFVVARIHLAGILAMSGDLSPACELAREAVSMLLPHDETVHMIDILGLAADIFLRAGDLRSADEILERAHGLAGRVIGMPRGAGRVRLRLGSIAIERGEYQLACELLQGADRQVAPSTRKREHGRILAELALSMRWMGSTDEAARVLSDVIRRSAETGDRLLHLICLCNLADIWCDSMKWQSASLTLERARRMSGELLTPDLELDLCNLDLMIAMETGNVPRQTELSDRILFSVAGVSDVVSAAWAFRTLSGASALAGDMSQARSHAAESVFRLYPNGNFGSLIRSLEATAFAVASSSPMVAAKILGACTFERVRIGSPRTPREARDFDYSKASIRQFLAYDETEANLYSGSSPKFDTVCKLALSLRTL